MSNKVTRAVFPVAGLGTRFLPATKASPKEMLTVVDKPLIQYAVEEAVAAGITELVFVTGRNKRCIEDHFDKAYELENELAIKGKQSLLDIVKNIIPSSVSCIYVRQAEALGLGHAVLCAKQVVGNNPFAVILADDLIDAKPGVTEQMIRIYDRNESSVIGVQEVPLKEVHKYGVVATEEGTNEVRKIKEIVEKPEQKNAPSNLAVVGRYILTPRIFHHLENIDKDSGGEIQLTDAIASLMTEEDVFSYQFTGTRYDCGSKLGYLQATVEYALQHPELSEDFRDYLENRG